MKYFDFKRGITREVILIGKYAIKIASFRSYKLFLTGILCNMQERLWTKRMRDDKTFAPVLFRSLFGIWLIMPRCTESNLTKEEAVKLSKKFRENSIPVEGKPCSFGWHKGNLVAIDYGS